MRLISRSQRSEMTIIEHLEELRTRLFKMVIAFVLGSGLSWFLYDAFLEILISPLQGLPESGQIITDGKLIFTSPTEAFFIRLKVTAFAGFVLALPVILWQIWRFVTPGLHKHEKRYAVPFVAASMGLFVGGVYFSFLMLPQALAILTSFAGTELVLLPRAADYLSFVLLLIGAFGLAFEFPLVLLSLTLVGVLDSRKLSRGRKFAWLGMLFASAIITPTQDPITMSLMAVPLILLFEATVLIARLMKR
ncbi:MAG: twin-arginine translocase subunit TatC [Actinobacteria bacterium]|nr:twin-arginine translocase subunit TatC [Actinomycetota bacterium]